MTESIFCTPEINTAFCELTILQFKNFNIKETNMRIQLSFVKPDIKGIWRKVKQYLFFLQLLFCKMCFS